jgi:hypothetical protein
MLAANEEALMANDERRTGRVPSHDERAGEPDADPGAYIGRLPEREAETIPGGVSRKDERVAGIASQPGARSPEPETPSGHREGEPADDDAIREAGQDR